MNSSDKLQEQINEQSEFHKKRQTGIGGSQVSSILGLNKYQDVFELYWYYKTPYEELANQEQSEAAYFGHIMEGVIVSEFEKRNNKTVTITNEHFRSAKSEFAVANVDGLIPEEKAIVECKTASEYLYSEWTGEEAPACYIIQCQWYMYVLGYEKAYLCAIVGGNKYVQHEIPRDDELIKIIVDRASDFWYNNVMKDVPPSVSGSEACEKYLSTKYSKVTDEDLKPLSATYKGKLEELECLKNTKKEIETNIRLIENELKNEIGENVGGYIGERKVYWKPSVTKRLDSKLLKEEEPELYEKYLKETSSRRFSVK